MTYLSCVEITPEVEATASVIWLHGLGADGNDFAPMVPALELAYLPIRFIFPHAPSLPVTINNGLVMPAWYDILEMSIDRAVDIKQLMVSSEAITALIDREVDRGINSQRIIVAGFSQGGAVAYQCALTYAKPLAGVLALSTYFASHEVIKPSAANAQIPLLICHGTADPVVPEILGQHAQEQLVTMGYEPQYKTYAMQHSVCQEEIVDIGQWIQTSLVSR